MSKPVKALIEKELNTRFKDLDTVAVINPRGINATKTNQMRRRLHDKGLKMAVVKNALARRASNGTKIDGFDKLLEGPSAVIYGKASASAMARLLLEEKKTDEKLELRGVFFDGEVYIGDAGVTTVSKLPTREEAIANVLAALLSPARKLAAALKGPGSTIGSILKTVEEKAKEKEARLLLNQQAPDALYVSRLACEPDCSLKTPGSQASRLTRFDHHPTVPFAG